MTEQEDWEECAEKTLEMVRGFRAQPSLFADREPRVYEAILRVLKNAEHMLSEALYTSQEYKVLISILEYIDQEFQKALPPKTFTQVLQGIATNKLSKINTNKDKKAVKDPFSGSLKITRKGFAVKVHDYMISKGLRQSTHQLLDALLETYTNSGGHSELITLPLRDYMTRRGITDEKSARQQVKEDLETLSQIRIDFTQHLRGGKKKDYFELGIIQPSKGIKNGIITVNLDSVFHTLLGGYKPMPYPVLLWRFNETHNPHAFYFLRKICEMKHMNAGKTNEDTIAVLTLLECSPNMPTVEEVAEKNRRYKELIIEPFERDMDALDEVLTWQYCHSNNEPLTDDELSDFTVEIFRKLYVKIFWRNYPDQSERLHRKALAKKTKNTDQRKPKG